MAKASSTFSKKSLKKLKNQPGKSSKWMHDSTFPRSTLYTTKRANPEVQDMISSLRNLETKLDMATSVNSNVNSRATWHK